MPLKKFIYYGTWRGKLESELEAGKTPCKKLAFFMVDSFEIAAGLLVGVTDQKKSSLHGNTKYVIVKKNNLFLKFTTS